MAVYVDNMRARVGDLILCHMVADTDEELHAMAEKIGMPRRLHQAPPHASHSHYDICQNQRKLALEHGAREISRRDLALKLREWKSAGKLQP